jgi:uncharacterized protein (TIGR03437 family)
VAIPLLYVSESQINGEIPAPLNGVDATIAVMNGNEKLPVFRVSVDPHSSAIFQNADGSIAAINQDGTVNSAENPAKTGTIVSIWGTGFGNAVGSVDGAISPSANNWCSYCQVSIMTNPTELVEYAGTAPGQIDAVMQTNFMVQQVTSTPPSQEFIDFSLGGGGFVWISQ